MSSYLKRAEEKSGLSRRSFIKASAAATTALATMGLAGCSNTVTPIEEDDTFAVAGERWANAACWHNCGGRCVNKVLVQDGVVVRQKTDDSPVDTFENPQVRSCCRGRSQRKQVFSADRLRYPMKRKHWEPFTGGDKSLRGFDEWERISWDEAIDYVAAEIKNAVEKYGNESIYCPAGDQIFRTLALYGGYTYSWTTTSAGNWFWVNRHGFSVLARDGSDRLDLLNCDYLVMFGCNPAWSAPGNPSWMFKQMKDKGVKFVGVDCFYNDSYEVLDANWIQVYPGTDTALLMGIAHTMLTDDPEMGLIDWDFLGKYTVGFDAEHMPEGAKPEENFKDYVLGTHDGTPKTPEWASEHCGTPVEQIKELAHILGKDNKVCMMSSFSAARYLSSEYYPAAFMTVGMMGGHMGKSGHCVAQSSNGTMGNQRPSLARGGSTKLEALPNPVSNMINDANVWDSILKGEFLQTGTTMAQTPGEKRPLDIHVIYHGGLNGFANGTGVVGLQTKPDINRGIEAHRAVDFVVTHAYCLTTNAKYSDIVLPVTTEWERPGTLINSKAEDVIVYNQICEPLFEAKSDQWIATEIAAKLGIDRDEVFPLSEKQQYFNQLATSVVANEEGTENVPLITITQEDIDEWGVEGEPQEGKITLTDMLDKGVYKVERKIGDVYSGYKPYAKYLADPEENPRDTPSGKFEIHSQAVYDMFSQTGYGNGTASPIPIWQETFKGYDMRTEEYPYQVYNPHYLRRSHSTFDNVGWLRKAWAHPVFLAAKDAADKGIVDGDTVLIYSADGKTLRQACVTERLLPGVVGLPHGGWVDIDEKTGIDRGGADNILLGSDTSISGVTGFNTALVNFEKYSGDPLIPDVEMPERVIFGEGE